MTEEMKSFVEKLLKDEDLQKKLQACKSPEEAFGVAKAVVSGLSMEEFTDTMKKINDSAAKTTDGELSEEDLEHVAGGWSDDNTVSVVTATVGAAGPAAASAI